MRKKIYKDTAIWRMPLRCLRSSDGGALQTPQDDPPPADPAGTNPKAAAPAGTEEAQVPPVAPAESGKNYTNTQLEELKAQWKQEFEAAKEAEKDFAKMTPEQQTQKLLDDQKTETARLLAELGDRDLTDYAREALGKAELPSEALFFIKGTDQADTDAKIKAFGGILASGIQAGVEKRFKANGYTPRTGRTANKGKERPAS